MLSTPREGQLRWSKSCLTLATLPFSMGFHGYNYGNISWEYDGISWNVVYHQQY